MEKTSKRLYYISFLQFIGPIFVVLGHVKNGLPYNEILQNMRTFIYVFHMPLFFFISAYLFSYKGGMRETTYKDFMKKKFLRLLFPYIILNLICFIPKVCLSAFIQDDMEMSFGNIINFWLNPRANILGHLWFLFALFEIYIFAPVWNKVIKKNSKIIWILLFVITLALRFVGPLTDILAINDLMRNLLFFILGMYIGKISKERLELQTNKKNFILYLFLYLLILVTWIFFNNTATTTLLCTITLLVLLKLPIIFKIKNRTIEKLSNYSYTIYILHWPIMIITRIVGYQILHINYIIVAIAMGLFGYFVPLGIIWVYKKLKKKFNKDFKFIYYLLGI